MPTRHVSASLFCFGLLFPATLVARGPRPTSASPPHSAFGPHSALWAPRWTAPAVTTWAPAGRVGGVPRGGHTWRGAVPSLGLGPRARPSTFYNAGQGMPSTSLTRPASGHDQRQAPAVGGALKKRRQLVKNAARVEKKGRCDVMLLGRAARERLARMAFFFHPPAPFLPLGSSPRARRARPPLPPRGASPRCRPLRRASCGLDPDRAGPVGPRH